MADDDEVEVEVEEDDDYFPILYHRFYKDYRMGGQAEYCNRMEPEDVDKAREDISEIFRICSLPESDTSTGNSDNEEEQLFGSDVMLMVCAGTMYELLKERANLTKSSRDGALLVLFQNTIITPKNIQALYRMCDPRIRTGYVRCKALLLLEEFGRITSTWKLQIPPDEDGDLPTSFGQKQIATMAKALNQRGRCRKPSGSCNDCFGSPCVALSEALWRAPGWGSPLDVLEVLDMHDWSTILDQDFIISETGDFRDYNFHIFICLHNAARRMLVDDPENSKAKTFLREKLGSCHGLWRRCLRHIVVGDIFTADGGSRFDKVYTSLMHFMEAFICCLAPLPMDRETILLIGEARIVLAQVISEEQGTYNGSRMPDEIQYKKIKAMQILLNVLVMWEELEDEPETARWRRFYGTFLGKTASAESFEYSAMIHRKERKEGHDYRNLEDGQMCASCYVLEKELENRNSGAGGNNHNSRHRFSKCSRCRQMWYCSRECQRKHWKEGGHKSHCFKAPPPAASASQS